MAVLDDAPREGLATRAVERVVRWETPATSYYMLLGASSLLILIGLVMVLSSSSVEQMASGASPYGVFGRQALFALIGVPLMWLASRISVDGWRRLAWPLVAAAVVAQCLVFTPLGAGAIKGNSNWIEIAGFRAQPSEAAKVALAVWCAAVLARKRPLLDRWAHVLVPVGPVAGLVLGLVLLGRDLGTGLVLMLIVVGALFMAGVPWRMFAVAGAAAAAVATLLVVTSRNRMGRITSWLSGDCDYLGECWQTTHGKWALASGGWWGVGLGASREKWSYLPEAHNDFIYAIIGEELGLPGTVAVLLLFAALGVACARVVRRHDDLFVKIATGAVLTWVVGQAIINMAVVMGLLPVIGVPLPLVSSGGSALICTMIALGMVMSFARSEPGAREVLAARAGVVRRSLAVVPRRRGSR